MPTAGWSGGSRSGCPRRSARRPGGRTGSAPTWTSRRRAGWSTSAMAAASGIEPDDDPWLPERAVWPLLEVVDESVGEPWLARLSAHLGCGTERPTRPARAAPEHRAPHRRALRPLRAAPAGDARGVGARGRRRPGRRRPLAGGAVAAAACAASRSPSPPSASRPPARASGTSPALVDLPERLSMFGLTRLPAGLLQVLSAIAAAPRRPPLPPAPVARPVGEASPRRSTRRARHSAPRRPDRLPARATACSPPGARTRARCSSFSLRRRRTSITTTPSSTDPGHAARPPPGRRARRPPPPARRRRRPPAARPRRPQRPGPLLPRPRPPGRGPARRDPARACRRPDPRAARRHRHVPRHRDLRAADPRDVRRGRGDSRTRTGRRAARRSARPPDLRVRLADRALRQTNPVLGVVAQLLELADARLTASEVLDLADREPVRRRFRLDDDDLARACRTGWPTAASAGASTPPHRAPFQLERAPGGHLARRPGPRPGRRHDDRGRPPARSAASCRSTTSAAARSTSPGRLAELVDRLRPRSTRSTEPRTIDAWADAIVEAADALTATQPGDAWQRAGARSASSTTSSRRRRAGEPATRPSWRSAEVRALLADRLRGRPTRANFRTGHLTICTLVPMRSVPHRVVCLLGLDDGVFPRKAPRDGDDLMLDDPHVGERDPRTEDRQLLLDALLAGDRPADRHLQRQRRAHERAASAGRAGRRAARGRRRTVRIRRRPGPRPGPRATIRCSRSTPATSRTARWRPTARGASTASRSTARARWPARGTSPPRSSRDPLPALRGAGRRGRGPRALRAAPGARVPAPAPRHRRRRLRRRDRRRACRSSSTTSRSGASASGCSTRCWPASTRRTAATAEIARGSLPPGVLGQPVLDEVCPIVDAIVDRGAVATGEDRRRLGRRPRRPARRPPR